jgi:hypothetical protein
MLYSVASSWYSYIWSGSYHFEFGGQNGFCEINMMCPILTNFLNISFKGKERGGKVSCYIVDVHAVAY